MFPNQVDFVPKPYHNLNLELFEPEKKKKKM